MPFPLAAMRRLHERGPRSRGLVVDRDGVMLGPRAVLVRRTKQGYRVVSADDLALMARVVFGKGARFVRLPLVLARIAKALEAGDLVRAQLLGLEIPIGTLDDGQLSRLGVAATLMKYGYDPDQPRDARGQWASEGGTLGASNNSGTATDAGSGARASDQVALDWLRRNLASAFVENNAKAALGNITNNAFTSSELDDIYHQVLRNIEWDDAKKFKDINPYTNPINLTPEQFRIVNEQIQMLTPDLRDKAQAEFKKAQDRGRVRCPACQ